MKTKLFLQICLHLYATRHRVALVNNYFLSYLPSACLAILVSWYIDFHRTVFTWLTPLTLSSLCIGERVCVRNGGFCVQKGGLVYRRSSLCTCRADLCTGGRVCIQESRIVYKRASLCTVGLVCVHVG